MMTAGGITSDTQKIIETYAYMFLPKPLELIQVRMLAKSISEELRG